MTARSAFVLAAVVVACGFARTSLEAQPRRQCPDPAPLYALRHLDADGMRRAFGLDARPWTVRLVSVLPPTAQRCHLAVARAELWRQTDSPRNAARVLLEARAVTLEMGIGPNGPAPVGGAPLDPADPRGMFDARGPDLDGDGAPDRVESAEVETASRCAYCECSLPPARVLRFTSGGRPIELQIGGTRATDEAIATSRAAIRSRRDGTPCPTVDAVWEHDEVHGEPMFRVRPRGIDVDVVVGRRTCRGLAESSAFRLRGCGDEALVLVHHEVRGGTIETRVSPAPRTSIVRADCAGCWLVAVPFALFDGETAPHPISTSIGPDEGARHYAWDRRAALGSAGLPLFPGVYLVEVTRDERRITYQVTVGIGEPPFDLVPP